MIYLLIILILIILSIQYDIHRRFRSKDRWYQFLLVVFILLAGLRWRVGGDTPNYLDAFYTVTPYIWDLTIDDFVLSRQEPFYFLLNVLVKSCGGKFYVVQIIQASIVNILMFKYFKKHVIFHNTCVLLYFIWIYAFVNFEEMRAGISVAICLFANDYIIQHKQFKGILLYLLATMFHYSAILMLLTPLLIYLRFNIKGILFLIFAFFIGSVVQKTVGNYLFLFEVNEVTYSKMASHIEHETYFSQILNFKGVLGSKFPYLFYAIISVIYLKRHLKNHIEYIDVIKLQPFLMMGLFWVIFSISVPISERFVRFYQPYFIIFMSCLIVGLLHDKNMDSCLASIKVFVLCIPFFWVLYSTYFHFSSVNLLTPMITYKKYVPYATIFDKQVGKERESNCSQEKSADVKYY